MADDSFTLDLRGVSPAGAGGNLSDDIATGYYRLSILAVEEGMSGAGNPQFIMRAQIVRDYQDSKGGERGKRMVEYFAKAAKGERDQQKLTGVARMYSMLLAIGTDSSKLEERQVTIRFAALAGKEFDAHVVHNTLPASVNERTGQERPERESARIDEYLYGAKAAGLHAKRDDALSDDAEPVAARANGATTAAAAAAAEAPAVRPRGRPANPKPEPALVAAADDADDDDEDAEPEELF